MLAGHYQVVDVLLVVGNVAPIALYFLFLGLVNSHSHPYLTTCRNDFITLTIVLVPWLMWPIPLFVESGIWWLLAATFLLATLVFFSLLPTTTSGFVIYNISEPRCQKILANAIRRLGWVGQWNGQTWSAGGHNLTLIVRGFFLLRNVTIHIEAADDNQCHDVDTLRAELERRLGAVCQLPSTMGASLVVLGALLLIIPMWMVGRHIDALVDAMSHLFG